MNLSAYAPSNIELPHRSRFAQDLTAIDGSQAAQAGPSRLQRRRSDIALRSRRPRTASDGGEDDEDVHWLSEDEGGEVTRPPPPTDQADPTDDDHRDDDLRRDVFDPEHKDDSYGMLSLLPPAIANGHVHKLHNRPAKPPEPPDSSVTAALPSTTSLLSVLATALECPACRDIMTLPTTLACGHAVCSSCTSLEDKPRSVPSTPVPLPAMSGLQRTGSTTSVRTSRSASYTSSILPNWLGLRRWSSGEGDASSHPGSGNSPPTAGIFGRASGSPKQPSVDTTSRPTCPHASCREISKTGPAPHVDVVLQKLVAMFIVEAPDRAPLIERFRRLSARPAATATSFERHSSEADSSSQSDETSSTLSMRMNEGGKRVKTRQQNGKKRSRRPSAADQLPEDAMEEDGIKLSPLLEPVAKAPRVTSFASEVLGELECQVCAYTIVTPLTTPCGHTFCRRCLMRSLDHSDKCPLCRSDLPPYAFFANHAANTALLAILESETGYKAVTDERLAHLAGESVISLRTAPVFVCSLSFPKLPTFLHVFEPRYRLMMRRAMETDKRFGMVLPQRPGRLGLYEYGTMLEIRDMQLLPDGRSVIETVGVYRFRVLESGMRDGYNTASIERIDDIPPEEEADLEKAELKRLSTEPEPSLQSGMSDDDVLRQQIDRLSTDELMATCRDFFEKLRTGSIGPPWLWQRLNNTFGPMPETAEDASYWLASVLPIDDYQKAQLLPVTSPRLRLRLVVFWVEQMRGRWWFGSGSCSIM